MGLITDGARNFLDIFHRLKKRDFSGNTGLVLKNSVYQTSTNILAKIGSLLFTVVLARILMPELFGLYNLVLSMVLIFYVFSDLGTNQSLIYFVSRQIGQKKYPKARSYVKALFTQKLFLTIISIVCLILFSKFVFGSPYKDTLFIALVAGSGFLFFSAIQSFLISLFYSLNDFKLPFSKEIIFQTLKVVFLPLALVVLMKNFGVSKISLIFWVMILLGVIYALTSFFLFLHLNNTPLKGKRAPLSRKEGKKLRGIVGGYSFLSLSLIFFGNIDKIILGHFVSPEFVGYYSAAFGIVSALIPLIIFSEVLFPVFLRIDNRRAENAFRKSLKITAAISILAFIFVLFFSKGIILLVFGTNYAPAINLLQIASLLILSFPATEVFSNYLISKGNLKKVSLRVFLTLLVNVVLAVLLPFYLLKYGLFAATVGVLGAMIFSRFVYLVMLVCLWKKNLNKLIKREYHGQARL